MLCSFLYYSGLEAVRQEIGIYFTIGGALRNLSGDFPQSLNFMFRLVPSEMKKTPAVKNSEQTKKRTGFWLQAGIRGYKNICIIYEFPLCSLDIWLFNLYTNYAGISGGVCHREQ